jgi:hypothetical protein
VEDKVKIRFVKGLKHFGLATCVYWIDEIHVDESLRNSPALNDIIRHELKHYEIIQKAIASKPFKRRLLLLYNDVWDAFSRAKIGFKHFRVFKKECIWTLVDLALLILIVFVWLKVVSYGS